MKRITQYQQLEDSYSMKGESVVAVAYAAQWLIDDNELRDAARELIAAEDRFNELLNNRDFVR